MCFAVKPGRAGSQTDGIMTQFIGGVILGTFLMASLGIAGGLHDRSLG